MAKDIIHDTVRTALEKDGWTITHDPYKIIDEKTVKYYIDLGAERLIEAEKGSEKIAIEVKSFIRESIISDFHLAVGQFMNYKVALEEIEVDRILYLAMPSTSYKRIANLRLLNKSIDTYGIKIIVIESEEEIITQWRT